jgi:Flp pilus assembly protein TadD
VGLTIRICRLILIGLAFATPAVAKQEPRSALRQYVEARMFDAASDHVAAARAYGDAMTSSPDEQRVIERAYRRAVEAGDRLLAVRAAQSLDAHKLINADARVLLFTESLAKGDWRAANLRLDQMEETGDFDFLVPIFRAWTRFASREGDPLTTLTLQAKDSLTSTYAREHRALLLFALKRNAEGFEAVRASATTDQRGILFRLSAAARLVQMQDKAHALQLLSGEDSALQTARAIVDAKRTLRGSIDTANKAVALLLARVSTDLIRDRRSPASLTLARIASFAAPPTDEIKLALANALANNGRNPEALTVLNGLDPVGPIAGMARNQKIAILQRADRKDEALRLAQTAVALPDAEAVDYELLGQAHLQLDHDQDGAAAFGEAIKRLTSASGASSVPWSLWLQYGSALEQAGDWAHAKPALETAAKLGPDQPAALNHLGYSMLEQHDNLDEAMRLIAKASALRPGDPAIADSLGWAFFLRGDTNQSISFLEKAVLADPTIAEIGEHLGDAYWTAGRKVDARYAWAAALVQADEGKDSARIGGKIANGLPTAK